MSNYQHKTILLEEPFKNRYASRSPERISCLKIFRFVSSFLSSFRNSVPAVISISTWLDRGSLFLFVSLFCIHRKYPLSSPLSNSLLRLWRKLSSLLRISYGPLSCPCYVQKCDKYSTYSDTLCLPYLFKTFSLFTLSFFSSRFFSLPTILEPVYLFCFGFFFLFFKPASAKIWNTGKSVSTLFASYCSFPSSEFPDPLSFSQKAKRERGKKRIVQMLRTTSLASTEIRKSLK